MNQTSSAILFLVIIILYGAIGYAIRADAQTKSVPEPQNNPELDQSCLKYELNELHLAANATDLTTADLSLRHAEAYQKLLEANQPC